jgi:lysophospholipase L1-like esterase
MKSPAILFSLFQLGLVGGATYLTCLTELPGQSILLLGLVGLATLIPEASPDKFRLRVWRLAAWLAWSATLLLPASLLRASGRLTFWHSYYAFVAWLITMALALAVRRVPQRLRSDGSPQTWKILAAAWAFLGEFIWLGDAYTQNREGDFYLGLAVGLGLLIGCKFWFRMPRPGILAVNTVLLLLIFLPAVDYFLRPVERPDPQPNVAGRDFLYEVAKQDPGAYRRYWGRYLAQYEQLMRKLSFPDQGHNLPYRVRTNIHVPFFQSLIQINSRGFRGREISKDKGRTYRIVALGESTTFGFTLDQEDRPWPSLLEELIRQRINPARPVRVINAGLPHYTLEDNLYRLRTKILALKPDLIISYHGWNGFPWLYPSLPPVFVKHLPDYKHRPLHILADCEYRLRLMLFKRSLRANPVLEMPTVAQLLKTRYGRGYGELVELARTNGIRLVIANYSMAVNSQSDPRVIEFYREAFPAVYPSMQVNLMHSMLVEALVSRNPEVCLVDTHPHLDGEHDKFIDLVHFSPEGDRQMAETMFAGITNILERDLVSQHPKSAAPQLP